MEPTTRPRAATTSPERTESPPADPVRSVYEAVDLRPLRRWLLERAGDMGLTFESHSLTDSRESYCDTPDWRLHRAGYTLRMCSGADHALGVLGRISGSGKEPGPPVTESFGSLDPGSFRSGSGPVAEVLTALLGARPVVRHIEFRRQGESYHLRSGERVLATLALVDVVTQLDGSDDPVRLSRFEVRTADDPPDRLLTELLEAAQRAGGLRPVQVSVFDSALLASGITPTKSPDLGSENIEPGRCRKAATPPKVMSDGPTPLWVRVRDTKPHKHRCVTGITPLDLGRMLSAMDPCETDDPTSARESSAHAQGTPCWHLGDCCSLESGIPRLLGPRRSRSRSSARPDYRSTVLCFSWPSRCDVRRCSTSGRRSRR